jgi:hypothetical protein
VAAAVRQAQEKQQVQVVQVEEETALQQLRVLRDRRIRAAEVEAVTQQVKQTLRVITVAPALQFLLTSTQPNEQQAAQLHHMAQAHH